MENSAILFGVMNIACGIVFILVGIPLAAGKVPMNDLYGFRLSQALVSDERWYAVNRYGGRQLVKWSVPLLGIGVLYFVFPMNEFDGEIRNALLAVAPIILCSGAAVVKTVIFARNL